LIKRFEGNASVLVFVFLITTPVLGFGLLKFYFLFLERHELKEPLPFVPFGPSFVKEES
jgi:hypothetical protein